MKESYVALKQFVPSRLCERNAVERSNPGIRSINERKVPWFASSPACERPSRNDVRLLAVALVLLATVSGNVARAQDTSMTLTVAPSMVQITLQPGETWSTEIQVVNGNPYDLTVYAEPVLFEASGEDGRPKFKTPPGMLGETGTPDPTTLAGWMTLPTGALVIGREQTITVPLTIHAPVDAAPGGHYAAILIGNRPPQGAPNESSLSVTSSIASLIMLRIAGTVVEDGYIRDFATEKMLYDTPEAQLSLRFENKGNVHLQPRGDITIYNMFGKIRGTIPINQTNEYGNVLPGSIRKFTYSWKVDAGLWDIGRYRAEATLGYGSESKSFAQSTTYFYILPLLPLAEMLGTAIATLLFVGWALRAYVRRAIAIETRHPVPPAPPSATVASVARVAPILVEEKPRLTLTTLIRPIQVGIVDLRSVASAPKTQTTIPSGESRVEHNKLSLGAFLFRYRYFFGFIVVVSVGWVVASALFVDVLTYKRPYEVHAVQEDGTKVPVR